MNHGDLLLIELLLSPTATTHEAAAFRAAFEERAAARSVGSLAVPVRAELPGPWSGPVPQVPETQVDLPY
jgi:hypothetical protein